MRNASALFDTLPQARVAVQQLLAQGFSSDQINLIANATDDEVAYRKAEDAGHTAEQVAEAGVLAGGLGGLLVGLSFLAVPGVGPILAAGGLVASLISGTALGALAGGAVALLVELGIPQEHAAAYAEAIRRGGALVVVQCSEERVDEANAVLSQQQPLNLAERSQSWRDSGWTQYEPSAPAYSREQIALERSRYAAASPSAVGAARGDYGPASPEMLRG